MYLNKFSVNIPEGKERQTDRGTYVEIVHGTQYTIELENHRPTRCNVTVRIDGKHQGTYRLDRYSSLTLETTPDSDGGRFTAYRVESAEGQAIGLTNTDLTGLIEVVFVPEKPINIPIVKSTGFLRGSADEADISRLAKGSSFSHEAGAGEPLSYGVSSRSMGTGLSGHSSQQFANASPIDLDRSQETKIYLRLKCLNPAPRPLVDSNPRSSLIPPPLN